MISDLAHTVLHAAHQGTIVVLALLLMIFSLLAGIFFIAIYWETFVGGWIRPKLLPAIKGETPEQLKFRSRVALFSATEITISDDFENSFKPWAWSGYNRKTKFLIVYFLLMWTWPTWIPMQKAYRQYKNTIYFRTHPTPAAPPLQHPADVSRTS